MHRQTNVLGRKSRNRPKRILKFSKWWWRHWKSLPRWNLIVFLSKLLALIGLNGSNGMTALFNGKRPRYVALWLHSLPVSNRPLNTSDPPSQQLWTGKDNFQFTSCPGTCWYPVRRRLWGWEKPLKNKGSLGRFNSAQIPMELGAVGSSGGR